MVSLNVSRSWLLEKLGVSREELVEALPNVKVEVDGDGEELSLEVTGDRPDLLSRQGILRALKGWFGQEAGAPLLEVGKPKHSLSIDSELKGVRPYAIAAFARGLKFDSASTAELMQVQEKLVLTHGRRRKKVAVGIHDAGKVEPPFSYEAVSGDYEFVPLGWREKAPINRILKEHEKGVEYAHCFAGSEVYPLFKDAEGVLSLPPVINSARTAVTPATTDLLLDVTGTDLEACNVALAALCQDFSDAGAKIEAVKCGKKDYPQAKPREMLLGAEYCNQVLGTKLSDGEIAKCLSKQRITASKAKPGVIKCLVPRYRADFLHQIDLVEEVALGYGYNEFEPVKPASYTKGVLSSETLLENAARDSLAGAGFVEANLTVLSSEETVYKSLLEPGCVKVRNPVSKDYGVLRPRLLPGLLDLLSANTHEPYPQRVFEVGEVVREAETLKSACAVSCHSNAGLSEAASILQVLLSSLGKEFELRKSSLNAFMPGRQASVLIGGVKRGFVGEVHPQALENFGLQMPCACFEVDL